MDMTMDDLVISLQNLFGSKTWCEIEQADDGEIVIRTGLKEVDGYLVDMDDE